MRMFHQQHKTDTANDKSYDATHDNLEDDTHQDIHQVSHQDSTPSAVRHSILSSALRKTICSFWAHRFSPQLGNQRPAILPAWLSCPLPAAFSGSPSQGHRLVSHADGHAVFKVQRAKRQQKSRHKTDHPCLRFFWKVMLVGYVTAESQDVQPRRAGTNM